MAISFDGSYVQINDRIVVVRGLYSDRVGIVSRIEGPYVVVGDGSEAFAVRSARVAPLPVAERDFAGIAALELTKQAVEATNAALEVVALFLFVVCGVGIERMHVVSPERYDPRAWMELRVDGVRVHRQRWQYFAEGSRIGLRLVQEWGAP